MLHAVYRLDTFVSLTRPAWGWVGQLAVVVLGVHLAADRIDDPLAGWLAGLDVAWPQPETPLTVATWCAVIVELAVCAWAAVTLLSASADPARAPREWWERASVRAVIAPLLWLTAGLAGTWVVQMTVEDVAAPFLLEYATPLAWLVAGLVLWRCAATGLLRVTLRLPQARRRLAGIGWAPLVVLVAILAVQHGLPIWGWLR